jgi:hypothetical protein
LKSFLLVYDRSVGRLIEEHTYAQDERARALEELFAREMKEKDRPNIEVVLFSAESRDALKKTHGRYFKTIRELLTELMPERSV